MLAKAALQAGSGDQVGVVWVQGLECAAWGELDNLVKACRNAEFVVQANLLLEVAGGGLSLEVGTNLLPLGLLQVLEAESLGGRGDSEQSVPW